MLDSWLEKVGRDGRVHGKVITIGAVTNRMTHSDPNIAQVPAADDTTPYGHEFRRCWTVGEGNALVGIDASGLELRMLAHYMNDPEYTDVVINGRSEDGTDIHTKNQIAAGLSSRSQAKTFIYGFLYGAGPAKIGSIVGGTSKEGQKLIDAFLKNTPKLKQLREKVARLAQRGYLPGLDGRILHVRSEHAALNTLLQGAGAIVMKKALAILSKELKRAKLFHKFVANVHDEWQIECKAEDAEKVGKLGVWSIEEAGRQLNMRCPLTGEYRCGKTWEDTH
jgi:DNA polymerase I-like protein with 3'-5' exonuclease and polymerase domains